MKSTAEGAAPARRHPCRPRRGHGATVVITVVVVSPAPMRCAKPLRDDVAFSLRTARHGHAVSCALAEIGADGSSCSRRCPLLRLDPRAAGERRPADALGIVTKRRPLWSRAWSATRRGACVESSRKRMRGGRARDP